VTPPLRSIPSCSPPSRRNGNTLLCAPLNRLLRQAAPLAHGAGIGQGALHHASNYAAPPGGSGALSVATLNRPADTECVRFDATSPAAVAVADFYGGAVHLYQAPAESAAEASAHDAMAAAPQAVNAGWADDDADPFPATRHLRHLFSIMPQRRGGGRNGRLERPSAVAVDATRARGAQRMRAAAALGAVADEPDDETVLRLLVAESGGCCVSVFHLTEAWQGAGVNRRTRWAHLCDICVEQLGTGVHAPLKGQWSWLGMTVTEAGDIVVADQDRGLLYRL
jgi:hypothetical protein